MEDNFDLKCTNPKIGRLLLQFEMGLLNERGEKRIVNHLFECQYCYAELDDELLPLIRFMGQRKETFANMLKEEGIGFDNLEEKLVEIRKKKRFWIHPFITIQSLLDMVHLLFTGVFGRTEKENNRYLPYLSFEMLPYRVLEAGVRSKTEVYELFRIGMKAYERGDYRESIKYLEMATNESPNEWDYWLYLGICYYLDHQEKLAIVALTKSETLNRFALRIERQFYLAQAFLMNNEPEKAIPLLKWIRDEKVEYSAKAESLLSAIYNVTNKN